MDEYRVLIVDDEEELVTTIAERLQIRGIQAQTANDGETAFKMIETNPPRRTRCTSEQTECWAGQRQNPPPRNRRPTLQKHLS